jgi:CHAT domain-containing protein/tetratricopeptide (TPR) repeat protein
MCALLLATAAAHGADPFDRCRSLARDHPDEPESFKCFHAAAQRHGLWDEAAQLLEAQLSLNPGNHQARFYLAGVEDGRGSQRAEELYRESVDAFAKSGRVEDEIHARLLLALYLRRRGRLQEAGDVSRPAAKLVDGQEVEPILVARVRIDEAWQAMAMGDHGGALGPMLAAEAIAFPDGPQELQAEVLSTMGSAYWGLGKFRKGIEIYRREAALMEKLGNRYGAAAPRYNIALLAGRLLGNEEMDVEEFLTLTEQALASAIEVGHLPLEARCRMLLGQHVEDEKAAVSHFERAVGLCRRIGDWSGARQARRLLAQLIWRTDRGRRDEALGWIDEAIYEAHSLGDLQEEARSLAVRAWMLWDASGRERGIEAYLRLFEAIERIRDLQPEGSVRARVFSQWTFPYYRLSGGLLKRLDGSADPAQDLEIAFRTMERMRSRVLLDELDGAGAGPVLDEAHPAFIQHAELLESVGEIQKLLRDPALPEDRREETLNELEGLESMEIVLRDELARAQPGYGRVRSPSFPTLAELQEELAADQALLLFQLADKLSDQVRRVSEGGSWLLAVTKEEVRHYPLPDRRDLKLRIGAFVSLLQRRDGSELRAAERLHEELLGEALRDLGPGIDRLLIVPDNLLHRLPFEALVGREGEQLALLYNVSYVPSATIWLRWIKPEGSVAPPRGLVFADPEISLGAGKSEERGEDPWLSGLRLNPLPHARKEAAEMVRSIGNDSRLLQAGKASEHALKRSDLSEFGLLHFAAHAVVDNVKPSRSAILLASGSSDEDGMLQIREIVDLDLGGQVVILTACRSASGLVMEGEGVVGLARAFFVAGARAVIGGLWSLKDDEAALFMKDFSGELARGRSLAEALSAARIAQLRAGAPPAAWAGIVLLGDGDHVPLPGGRERQTWPVYLLAGLLVMLLGAVAVILRRRYF